MNGNRTVLAAFRTIAVTLGAYHTCAILTGDNGVRCWGRNTDEQVLPGDANDPNAPPVPEPTIAASQSAVAVAAGAYHTCELLPNGMVHCWGLNGDGQAGVPPLERCRTYGSCGVGQTVVPGVSSAIAITAGGYHTCALLADATIKCWGLNANGQLGDGSNHNAYAPVTVSGLSDVKAIAAGSGAGTSGAAQLGGYHSCALLSNGTLRCWGHNRDGQLGNGSNQDSNQPVTVAGISTAVAVAAGAYHTCAILSSGPPGHIECWGHNADGELGSGSNQESNRPVPVVANFAAIRLAAGGFHTCAIVSAAPPGAMWCWGHNADGELGNRLTTATSRAVPVFGL